MLFGGYISYDKDFFESLGGISPDESNNGKFVIPKLDSFVTTPDQTFATFSIKVKSDATGTGKITFSELEFATAPDGEDYKLEEPIELSFTVQEENPAEDTNTEPDTNTNPDSNTTPDTNTNSNSNSSSGNISGNISGNNTAGGSTTNSKSGKVDNTTSATILPKTGIKTGLIILISILTITGIYLYRLSKKYKDI